MERNVATDGWILRRINRPLAAPLVRVLLPTRVTPNQVTLFSIGLGLVAAGLVLKGGSPWVPAGGVLMQVIAILDCVDGDLARLRNQISRLGAWLDTLSDRIGLLAFLAAAVLGLVSRGKGGPGLFVPLGLVAVATLLGYAASSLWRKNANAKERETFQRFSHRFRSHKVWGVALGRFFVFVTRREFLALLFMGFALWNRLDLLLALIGIGSAVASLVLVVLIYGLSVKEAT